MPGDTLKVEERVAGLLGVPLEAIRWTGTATYGRSHWPLLLLSAFLTNSPTGY
jgi:hypothetical protein